MREHLSRAFVPTAERDRVVATNNGQVRKVISWASIEENVRTRRITDDRERTLEQRFKILGARSLREHVSFIRSV